LLLRRRGAATTTPDQTAPFRSLQEPAISDGRAPDSYANAEVAPGCRGLVVSIGGAEHALASHHPAAIHVDHLTGDVPGPVRSQEQDGFGDLLRPTETPQRVHRDCLLDVLG